MKAHLKKETCMYNEGCEGTRHLKFLATTCPLQENLIGSAASFLGLQGF